MARRVSVLGALLLGLLAFPSSARAHCHEDSFLRAAEEVGLGIPSCLTFVEVKLAGAFGAPGAVAGLLMPNAEVKYDAYLRVRGADAAKAVENDQKQFRHASYTAVVTAADHVPLVAGAPEDSAQFASNLATVTWAGVIQCKAGASVAECDPKKVEATEVVWAALTLEKDVWRILSMVVHRKQKYPPKRG